MQHFIAAGRATSKVLISNLLFNIIPATIKYYNVLIKINYKYKLPFYYNQCMHLIAPYPNVYFASIQAFHEKIYPDRLCNNCTENNLSKQHKYIRKQNKICKKLLRSYKYQNISYACIIIQHTKLEINVHFKI